MAGFGNGGETAQAIEIHGGAAGNPAIVANTFRNNDLRSITAIDQVHLKKRLDFGHGCPYLVGVAMQQGTARWLQDEARNRTRRSPICWRR
jgi:hypothetical protein